MLVKRQDSNSGSSQAKQAMSIIAQHQTFSLLPLKDAFRLFSSTWQASQLVCSMATVEDTFISCVPGMLNIIAVLQSSRPKVMQWSAWPAA